MLQIGTARQRLLAYFTRRLKCLHREDEREAGQAREALDAARTEGTVPWEAIKRDLKL